MTVSVAELPVYHDMKPDHQCRRHTHIILYSAVEPRRKIVALNHAPVESVANSNVDAPSDGRRKRGVGTRIPGTRMRSSNQNMRER